MRSVLACNAAIPAAIYKES